MTAGPTGRTARARVRRTDATGAPAAKPLGLTEAQYEVLVLLCQGLTVAQIAERLSRAESSIYGRIERLKTRLHISSDAELIAFAIKRGVQ